MSVQMPSLFDDEYLEPILPEKEKKADKEKRIPKESDEIANDDLIDNDINQHVIDGSEETNDLSNSRLEEIQAQEEQKIDGDVQKLEDEILLNNIQTDYFEFVKDEKKEPEQVVKRGIVFEKPAIVVEEIIITKKERNAYTNPELKSEVDDVINDDNVDDNDGNTVTLPEWDLEDKYYSIGEVSKLFGVNTSHIRFWTSEFSLKPRTTRKGDRLYSLDDIRKLRLIHHLVKEKKHTIKGAKEKLKTQRERVKSGLTLKDSLLQLRDKLVSIQSQL